jgi:hypothetical protein
LRENSPPFSRVSATSQPPDMGARPHEKWSDTFCRRLRIDSLIDKTMPKLIRRASENLPKRSVVALDNTYKKAMDRIEGLEPAFQKFAKSICWIESTVYDQGSTLRCPSGRDIAHWQETRSFFGRKDRARRIPQEKGIPRKLELRQRQR